MITGVLYSCDYDTVINNMIASCEQQDNQLPRKKEEQDYQSVLRPGDVTGAERHCLSHEFNQH